MNIQYVIDFIKSDERGKFTAERVLSPLFDCTKEELDQLIDALNLASARTTKAPITDGMKSQWVLDSLKGLAYAIRATK